MKKLLCLLFFIFVSLPTLAMEKINSFHSDINIQLDGSVIITETLNIRHEGKSIRKGLVRSLPINSGEKYKLISVKRNGKPEPSFVEQPYGFYEINTGDDSFLPSPADSTFEITYQVWNILRKYDSHDELYWNVTGDDWSIPISKASATVHLPQNVQMTKEKSFAGSFNSKNAANYHGNGQWSAPHPLFKGEHLTIVVGFTPNIINITTPPKNEYSFFNTNISNETYKRITILYILFLGYCITVWYLKGRDPASHAIMPLFDAPKDISASTAYLLMNQGKWSATGTLAALVQMIQNGFLTTHHQEEDKFLSKRHIFTFSRTEKAPSNSEEEIYNLLLGKRNLIITSDQYSGDLKNLDAFLKNDAKKKNKLLYTLNNKWIWPAWVIFALLFYMSFLSSIHNIVEYTLYPICLILCIPMGIARRVGIPYKYCLFGFLTLLGVSVICSVGLTTILSYIPILAILSIITAFTFNYYMYRPSQYGQDVIEQLKGLDMFLSATHRPSDAKTLTPEKMEELFPFALALGLEDKWEAKFKAIFGLAMYDNLTQTRSLSRHHYTLRDNIRTCITPPSRGWSGFSGGSGFGRGGRSGGGFGGGGGRGR